ncbi:probable crossover junction endonuclease EME2 isoform X4 [Delphinapterus leucas]|uniref:Probable crossover junction endonuclease EME2 isoform X4 n=1 Tax=Delphinapterus leucas TaxID=9749 RepID=A0A2Y9Q3Q6_DELLE|nr:probable crossover junction endonuclease EME2 isoform X4 [Delphinapterus leucas]
MSDSDIEGPAGEEAAARVRDPAEERRAAAEVLRQLRPEQDVRRLAVLVDPAILEDAGADILMEALDALSCEYRVEPERPAWSLRWSRVKPDPCSLSVPPEVWAADEQDWLLLLEPEEFLQGVVQLTQAVPGVWGLFLLHHRVLGSSREEWQEMAPACGGLVAADQAVQLCQPGCGQCCCCCLPFPLPSATGLNAARPGNRLETTSGGVREQDTQYDLHRGSQAASDERNSS